MIEDEIVVWGSARHGTREMRTDDRFHLIGDPRWLTFVRSVGRREVLAIRPGDTAPVIVHLDSIGAIMKASYAP